MARSITCVLRGLTVLGLALSIAGCGGTSVRDSLGFGKRSPDEFAVVKRQPLIIPPDYDLRPPRPGAESTAVASADERARAAITGTRTDGSAAGGTAVAGSVAGAGLLSAAGTPEPAQSGASPGQAALLAEAGAAAGDSSGIREQIAIEAEGRTEVAPATFEQIVGAPGDAGPEPVEVIEREQTPIDLAE